MRRRHQHIGHGPHGEHGDGDADQAARVRIGGESHDENQSRERDADCSGRASLIELAQSCLSRFSAASMGAWLSDCRAAGTAPISPATRQAPSGGRHEPTAQHEGHDETMSTMAGFSTNFIVSSYPFTPLRQLKTSSSGGVGHLRCVRSISASSKLRHDEHRCADQSQVWGVESSLAARAFPALRSTSCRDVPSSAIACQAGPSQCLRSSMKVM